MYVISHYICYDDEFLNLDKAISSYYIVRSNYNDNGYLPFILSILKNSTYSLIIRDEDFPIGFPDGFWIDDSIRFLRRVKQPYSITCDLQYGHFYGIYGDHAYGCLFMDSLM